MTQLEFEFIHQRRLPWLGLGFFAVSALILGSQVVAWIDVQTTHQDKLERVGQLERALKERQRSTLQAQSNIIPALTQRIKDQVKIVEALRYPWNRTLATMEKASSGDVAILSLNHDQSTGLTQLAVEALDVAALIGFVEKINDVDEGKKWYLANYQVQLQNNPVTVKGTVLNK